MDSFDSLDSQADNITFVMVFQDKVKTCGKT